MPEIDLARGMVLLAATGAVVFNLMSMTWAIIAPVIYRRWLRVADTAHLALLLHIALVMVVALWTPWDPTAEQVRETLHWSFPPIILFPAFRSWYWVRLCTRGC